MADDAAHASSWHKADIADLTNVRFAPEAAIRPSKVMELRTAHHSVKGVTTLGKPFITFFSIGFHP
jgi:hypothetical protein